MKVVSRDFTRTKHPTPFKREMDGLTTILRLVERPVHVLLVGVGEGNAWIVRESLPAAGASWTFVTARPTLAARRGVLLPDRDAGDKVATKSDLDLRKLTRENIRRFTAAVVGENPDPIGQLDLFSQN